MRIAPIMTALGAIVVLFLLVFQRDAVLSFAGYEAVAQTTEAEAVADALDGPDETPGTDVVAVESTAREIDAAVVLRGRTQAARKVNLLAETSGRVISDPTPAGTEVSKGDVLCRIDMGTREASRAQAEAALAQAKTELKNASALSDSGYASDTRVIAAKAGVAGAEAALATIENDIAHTSVIAPFDALLEDETTAPGNLLQPGGLCATLVDLNPIRLVGYVSEADIDRVTVGAPMGARLSSGREVTGRLSFVSRSADPQTHTFRIEAELPNDDLSIRDGQSAEMLIQSNGRKAHLVPQSVLSLDDNGALGVRVVEQRGGADVAGFVPVEMLRDSPDGVWVAGLPDSAKVIVEGQNYVTSGTRLNVIMRGSGS
ncbi:MAG: efflux RND transporter periplasmic adaptor subunit [Maritimibacter sp.]